MVTETNDKYPHKPSAKHTLEEVRKSLEDLVRNEFEDVEATPQPAQPAPPDTPEDDRARRPLSTLPRRKPAGLDTTHLLRSLKGLISDELSGGEGAPAQPQRGDNNAVVEHDDEAVSTAGADQEYAADADSLAGAGTTATEAVPAAESEVKEPVAARRGESEAAGCGEQTTLDAPDVPSAARVLEGAEGDLEALEKMTETLGKAPRSLTPIPDDGGERHAAGLGPEEPTLATPSPPPALDPATQPWSQLPLLKVIDLPETGRTQRAFAVQDPVFAADPRHTEDEGHLQAAAPVSQPAPMFISRWLDEDPARQATDFELGLSTEDSDAATQLAGAAAPTLDETPAVDPQEITPGPAKLADAGEKLTGIDEQTTGTEPSRESSTDQPGWGEIDALEIPGGDAVAEDAAETEIVLPAPDIDDLEAEALELTLETPEETAMPHETSTPDTDEQVDIDLSADSSDEPEVGVDRPSEREHVEAESSRSNKEQETAPMTAAAPPAPEASRREVKREHRTSLGHADNSFMKTTAIDFNTEPSPAENAVNVTAPESSTPAFDPDLDLGASADASEVELPPPDDEPKDTVETPPSPPLSLAEEPSPGVRSKDLEPNDSVKTPSPPLSLAEESSPRVRSKDADKEMSSSKRPRPDSPQPAARTQGRPERPPAEPKSGKTELTLEPDARQKLSEQDAAQQTGSASGVPEWYRRPFKVEQVAPVKPPGSGAKAPHQQVGEKPKSPARASPGKIPVLDAVVTERERPKAKAPAVTPDRERPKAKTAATGPAKPLPATAQKVGRRDSAAARSLAIQVVAKLNMELRKCGERALSPAIVDRLQYLLREALAQGGSDVDNSKNKKP